MHLTLALAAGVCVLLAHVDGQFYPMTEMDKCVSLSLEQKDQLTKEQLLSAIHCLVAVPVDFVHQNSSAYKTDKLDGWIKRFEKQYPEDRQLKCFTQIKPTCLNIPSLTDCFKSLPVENRRKLNKLMTEYTRYCDGSLALKFMNVTANPCEDFYQYACGGTYDKNIQDMTNVHRNKIIADIVEGKVESKEYDFVKKMRKFFNICMDEDQIQKVGLDFYLTKYKQDWATLNPKWKSLTFDINAIMQKYEKKYTQALINIEVWLNRANTTVYTLWVVQPQSLGLPVQKFLAPNNSKDLEKYEQLYVNLTVALGADRDTALQDARDVVDFERNLSKIFYPSDRPYDYILNKPRSLSNVMGTYKCFDFKQLLQAFYTPFGKTIQPDTMMNFIHPDYYQKLCCLLAKTSNRTIQNFYSFTYARKVLPETNKVMQSIFNKYSGAKKDNRKRKCIDTAHNLFSRGVGKIYVDKFYSEEAQKKATEIKDVVKDEFEKSLNAIKWMSQESLDRVKEKLSSMKFIIGYPKTDFEYEDLEKEYKDHIVTDNYALSLEGLTEAIQRNHFALLFHQPVNPSLFSPSNPNSLILLSENSVIHPAIRMFYPYASPEQQSSSLYGTVGFDIADAILLHFGTLGITHDKNGQLGKLLSDSDETKLDKKIQCFKKQFNRTLQVDVNSALFLAFNDGMKLAFRAYQTASAKHRGEKPLPYLNLSLEKQFFLRMGRIVCKNDRVAKPNMLMENSEDFSHAFNCPVGSRMNPKERCPVWLGGTSKTTETKQPLLD